VLSPTKVSGQCGRLKCCLVYEQAGYAEMRKGLPKLGKRVVSARGEGRVVEVDVLRQRIRVSYGPGDTEVLPAAEVKPLFPSGNQRASTEAETPDDEPIAGIPDDDPAPTDAET
jgi:cell fate regulator YaaT (PSP1 superfamily)